MGYRAPHPKADPALSCQALVGLLEPVVGPLKGGAVQQLGDGAALLLTTKEDLQPGPPVEVPGLPRDQSFFASAVSSVAYLASSVASSLTASYMPG